MPADTIHERSDTALLKIWSWSHCALKQSQCFSLTYWSPANNKLTKSKDFFRKTDAKTVLRKVTNKPIKQCTFWQKPCWGRPQKSMLSV